MQKTIEYEIEQMLKELFVAFGKNLKYEKERIRVYTKFIIRFYTPVLDVQHFVDVCDILVFTRTFLPTVSEITDAYDFCLWCKRNGDDKNHMIISYREYIQDGKNKALKGFYNACRRLEG